MANLKTESMVFCLKFAGVVEVFGKTHISRLISGTQRRRYRTSLAKELSLARIRNTWLENSGSWSFISVYFLINKNVKQRILLLRRVAVVSVLVWRDLLSMALASDSTVSRRCFCELPRPKSTSSHRTMLCLDVVCQGIDRLHVLPFGNHCRPADRKLAKRIPKTNLV